MLFGMEFSATTLLSLKVEKFEAEPLRQIGLVVECVGCFFIAVGG